jgi:HK97 family phage portal protein
MKFFNRKKEDKEKAYNNISSATDYLQYFNEDYDIVPNIDRYATSDDIYSVINILSSSAASIPLKVYNLNGEKDDKHYLNELLKKVNPQNSLFDFLYNLFTTFYIYGEVFILFEHNSPINKKDITSMWLPSPERVTFEEKRIIDTYTIRTDKGELKIPSEDIVHIKLTNPANPYRGLSPLTCLTMALDMELEAKKVNTSIFKDGILASSVISVSAPNVSNLKIAEENIKKYISGNKRSPIFVWGDSMDVKPLNISPKDIEFTELDKITTRDVAKVYRVPMQLLAQEDSYVLNLKTYRKILMEDTVLPCLKQVIGGINHKLLNYYDDIEINYDISHMEIFSESETEKIDRVLKMIQIGVNKNKAWEHVFNSEVPEGFFNEENNGEVN